MNNKRLFEYTDKKSGLTYRRSPMSTLIICYRGKFENGYGCFERDTSLGESNELFDSYSEAQFKDSFGTSRERYMEALGAYTKEVDSKLFSDEPFTEYTMYLDRDWIVSNLNICAVEQGGTLSFLGIDYSMLYKDVKTRVGVDRVSFVSIYGKADAEDKFICKDASLTNMRVLKIREYPSHIEVHAHTERFKKLALGEAVGIFDFEGKQIYF